MKSTTKISSQSRDSDLWQWAQEKQEQRIVERVSNVRMEKYKGVSFSKKLMDHIRQTLIKSHRGRCVKP